MRTAHPSESATQQGLIRWWSFVCKQYGLPDFALMGFPLQGARTARNGARLKAEGMRAGTPDLFLAVPVGSKPGLWIEMKTPIGTLTPAQKSFRDYLSRSYAHHVCKGLDEARTVIDRYLKGTKALVPTTEVTALPPHTP